MTHNNINNFPIDNDLKQLVANMIVNKLENAGITVNSEWVKDEFSEDLILNVLESISQWVTQKLN